MQSTVPSLIVLLSKYVIIKCGMPNVLQTEAVIISMSEGIKESKHNGAGAEVFLFPRLLSNNLQTNLVATSFLLLWLSLWLPFLPGL